MIFGEEVSQRGTPHLQGYVVFENAVSQPSQYFSEFGNGHFELAMGSAMQNITYCSKGGKFSEHGVRPQDQRDQGHHGAKGGKRNAGRWEEAWQAAKRGNIDEVPADIRWKYYSTFTKVATRYRTPPAELEGLDNMWIMGPSGPTGMPDPTARAHEKNLTTNVLMLKMCRMRVPFRKPISSGIPELQNF